MSLSEKDLEYLKTHQAAAMITVGSDGRPKVARVAVTLVGGKLWSSGTADRARTKRLRRDPRCTLFVFDSGWSWLTLETTVRFLEGPDAADLNLRLFRTMQDRPTGDLSWFGKDYDEEAFRKLMVDEGRLIYEFDVQRTYGMH